MSKILDDRRAKLEKDLTICREVADTVNSPGWQKIIGPTLDKMIIDILGGKINDRWLSGKLDKARTDEKREFYIGAKQALIELHQRVQNHVRQIPLIESQLKDIVAKQEMKTTVPMEDTRYAVKKGFVEEGC